MGLQEQVANVLYVGMELRTNTHNCDITMQVEWASGLNGPLAHQWPQCHKHIWIKGLRVPIG